MLLIPGQQQKDFHYSSVGHARILIMTIRHQPHTSRGNHMHSEVYHFHQGELSFRPFFYNKNHSFSWWELVELVLTIVFNRTLAIYNS